MSILTKATVLVLNRNWQAINVRTPQEPFRMMATNLATGPDIERGDGTRAEALRPVTREEWLSLPSRDQDETVHTVRGQIRVPTVIVAVNFANVPKKRPKLCVRAIRERDPDSESGLPVHRPFAAAGGGQPGPRGAPLPRRQGCLGEPGLVGQGSEPAQGRPPPARGRPEAAVHPPRAEETARLRRYSESAWRKRLEAVRGRLNPAWAAGNGGPSAAANCCSPERILTRLLR